MSDPRFSRAYLLEEAESRGDETESVFSAEMLLLLNVASTSSDLVMARALSEFAQAMGGIEVLEDAHVEAVKAWESWLADSDD
jgi:hypothetical protein